MSRRAILRLTDYSASVKEASEFFSYVTEFGAGPRAKFQYQVDKDGNPCLVVELPEGAAAVLERRERPPVRTKTQQAVHDRLEARKAAVAAGEPVPGHEKPLVKRKGLKKPRAA